MRIPQICTSCSSVYDIAASTYNSLSKTDAAYCPVCGHPNIKQKPAKKHRSATIHSLKLLKQGEKTKKQLPAAPVPYGQKTSKMRLKQLSHSPQPLEAFRQRISEVGRVFIIGDRCLNRYDIFKLNSTMWPTIGIGDAFRLYPDLDAVILTENKHIKRNLEKLSEWQAIGHSRYIFWRRENGEGCLWRSQKDMHGLFIEKTTGAFVEKKIYPMSNANVVYFDNAEYFNLDITIPMQIVAKDGPVFSAIHLALQLGAKEIILVGVDIGTEIKQNNEKIKHCSSVLSSANCRLISCEEAFPLPSGAFERLAKASPPFFLQCLREKIQYTGKCFLLGAGASLNVGDLHRLVGYPVIGCNSAFFRYPLMDALIFGDEGFKRKQGGDVRLWQRRRTEKPILFWHEAPENLEGFSKIVNWRHSSINPICEQPHYVETLELSIKRSIITPAINLAYWLGAREIYLLGVDLDNLLHFWDMDGKVAEDYGHNLNRFPGGRQIADFIVWQAEALKTRDVQLSTCYNGGLLQGKLPYVPLSEAANPHNLNNNPCFGGKKKK